MVKTPTKPTTNTKVGSLLDPENDDDSVSRPILPAKDAIHLGSDALDKSRQHLAQSILNNISKSNGIDDLAMAEPCLNLEQMN